jgi:phospholipid-translocating P-type ATPase (flippase)
MEEVEGDLQLLGVTAIEDKLQDGVPRCISDLRKAGISIWVLTGDKEETAINIGFACQLIDNDMRREVINMNIYANEQEIRARIQLLLKQVEKEGPASASVPERALVIDGEALGLVMEDPELRLEFMQFGIKCKSCICCRVSPAQKAEVVDLFRELVPDSQTLAIGDGANDVAMIQSAHVGIGISGQEGLQAVNASDFAIAQFRFLRHLLLRHGLFNYHRVSKVVLYMFYKNLAFVLTQYWYICIYNGFSGQKYYNEFNNQVFNIIYTGLPIVFLGVFDKIVDDNVALKFPRLYENGIKKLFFDKSLFVWWMVTPVLESLLMFTIATQTFKSSAAGVPDDTGDLWAIGSVAAALVAMICNGKVVVNTFCWHYFKGLPWEFFFIFISLCGFLVFNLIISATPFSSFVANDTTYDGVYVNLLLLSRYWLAIIIVCPLILGKDVVSKYFTRIDKPELFHIVQEASSMDKTGQYDHVDTLRATLAQNAAKAKIAAHAQAGSIDSRESEMLDVAGVLSTPSPSPGGSGFMSPLRRANSTSGFAYSSCSNATSVEAMLVTGGRSMSTHQMMAETRARKGSTDNAMDYAKVKPPTVQRSKSTFNRSSSMKF